MKKPTFKPPKDIGLESRKLWLSMRDEYQITDATGLNYLTSGCRHHDRMRQAQQAIAKDGTTIADRFGIVKAHPACTIERDASAAMVRCFKALNLDIEPLRDRPGRPPGR